MKILVVAPHPDDEVLGCGGIMKKYSKRGDEVYLCVVTQGYSPDWSEEFLRNLREGLDQANRILGTKEKFFLGFPTAKLDMIPQKELNDALFRLVETVQPDVIYAPSMSDLSRDHRCIFESLLVAVRPKPGMHTPQVLCYEVLSETDWGTPLHNFVPNVYEDITNEFGDKIEAMKAYKSELKDFPHPRSVEAIEALAKKRGSEVGTYAAEAFVLIRSFQK